MPLAVLGRLNIPSSKTELIRIEIFFIYFLHKLSYLIIGYLRKVFIPFSNCVKLPWFFKRNKFIHLFSKDFCCIFWDNRCCDNYFFGLAMLKLFNCNAHGKTCRDTVIYQNSNFPFCRYFLSPLKVFFSSAPCFLTLFFNRSF